MIDSIINGFTWAESVLQKRREQAESVKGKETPFRVEFRYKRGSKSWQYFETVATARRASDCMLSYGPTGNLISEFPTSQHVQVKGPRGGWSKYDG